MKIRYTLPLIIITLLCIVQCNSKQPTSNNKLRKDIVDYKDSIVLRAKKEAVVVTHEVKDSIGLDLILDYSYNKKNDSIVKHIKYLKSSSDRYVEKFIRQKTLKFSPNNSVVVLPVLDSLEAYKEDFDSYIILTDISKKEILGIYRETNYDYRIAEPDVDDIIIIDDKEFKIKADKSICFGVKVRCNSFYEGDELLIFNQGKTLNKVFSNLNTIKEDRFDLSGCDTYEMYADTTSILISKKQNFEFYNIILNKKSVNKKRNTETCQIKTTELYMSKTVKFDSIKKEYNLYDFDIPNFSYEAINNKILILPDSVHNIKYSVMLYDNYKVKNPEGHIIKSSKSIDYFEPSDTNLYQYFYVDIFSGWSEGNNAYIIDKEILYSTDLDEKYLTLRQTSNLALDNFSHSNPIVLTENFANYEGLVYMVYNENYREGEFPFWELRNDYFQSNKITNMELLNDKVEVTVLHKNNTANNIIKIHLSFDGEKYFAEIVDRISADENEGLSVGE